MNYKELSKANSEIKTTPIHGKQYAEVKERINAFRKLYPEGYITTDIVKLDENVCIMRAEVGTYDKVTKVIVASETAETVEDVKKRILGTGTACEYKTSSNINRTSYTENAETSAIGRALGMCGIGIDVAIASAEEIVSDLAERTQAVPTEPKKDDPELKACKEQFAAVCKNHQLNGAVICKQFGIGRKPTVEQLLTALEAMAKTIQANQIPAEWTIKKGAK